MARAAGTTKAKRGRKLPDDPAEAFKVAATTQVQALLKRIRLLRSYAMRRDRFEFTKDQSTKIFSTLQAALDDCKRMYERPPEAAKSGDLFEL